MQRINYDALPPEVATFRDYLTLVVKYPKRSDLIALLEHDKELYEQYLAVYQGKVTEPISNLLIRNNELLHFVRTYVTDDGETGWRGGDAEKTDET